MGRWCSLSCRDLLLNFGGHTYAAGLTLRWSDVREFRNRFQAYVDSHIQPEQTEACLLYTSRCV